MSRTIECGGLLEDLMRVFKPDAKEEDETIIEIRELSDGDLVQKVLDLPPEEGIPYSDEIVRRNAERNPEQQIVVGGITNMRLEGDLP